MQHRLNPLKTRSNSKSNSLIKVFIIISILGIAFYFIEKVQLPSPQKEIEKNVTDKIEKIK
tara:strand:+ start:27 stop:209 length:183 start_codon:yes stop_codon:yes gene_type:complete